MENNITELILDKNTKVCVCKAISRHTIKESIKAGAKTLEEVQKATGAGTGSCKGCRCNHVIQNLIDSDSNN